MTAVLCKEIFAKWMSCGHRSDLLMQKQPTCGGLYVSRFLWYTRTLGGDFSWPLYLRPHRPVGVLRPEASANCRPVFHFARREPGSFCKTLL